MNVPTGYFHFDHQAWGDVGRSSVVSRGYAFQFPDTSSSDDDVLLSLQDDLRLILANVRTGERMQVHLYTNSDAVRSPLNRFHGETVRLKGPEASHAVRHELYDRFSRRVEDQQLIQTNAIVYLSSSVEGLEKQNGKKVRGFDRVFEVIARSFQQREVAFNQQLRPYGGEVCALDNLGHYLEMLRFWSPGQARHSHPEQIDWMRTIPDLCLHSGVSPRVEPDHGFCLDGHYVGIFAFKTMPSRTNQRTMDVFHALTVPGIRVILNFEPLATEKEIAFLKQKHKSQMTNVKPEDDDLEINSAVKRNQGIMDELTCGERLPFRVQVLVIATDRDALSLDGKMESLRVAIGKTGAEPYQPMLPTEVMAYFNCATPGFGPFVRHPDYRHRTFDLRAANLFPCSSTPSAELDRADWIADGNQNNLIGGALWQGGEPMNVMVSGMKGSGKSALMQTILFQTAPLFKAIVIVEDGESYVRTARSLDPTSRCLSIRAEANYTFNLFDTDGLPKSSDSLSGAVSLAHLLIGKSDDQDRDKLRKAILTEAIESVYGVAYRSWRARNPEKHLDLCREAHALFRFKSERMDEDASLVDAFLEARSLRREDPKALAEFEEVDDDAALALDRNPETGRLVENLAFSTWTPAQFPTLDHLQDALRASSTDKGPFQELKSMLAIHLVPWLRHGIYGPIVDGATNVDLGDPDVQENSPLKVIHFDIGMSKAEAELKNIVGFLVSNHANNYLRRMPRRFKKAFIVEELHSFLEIPDGDSLVNHLFERSRKYNILVAAIMQQFSSVLAGNTKVAQSIIFNSDALFLLRNHSRHELEAISTFVPIPEPIKDAVASFPKPESMRGRDDAYAGFVYANLTGPKPQFTVGRNVISREVERLTSSSGDTFDQPLIEFPNAPIPPLRVA